MPKLLLSDEEIFTVVESVWATSLGLPTELAAKDARSEPAASSVNVCRTEIAGSCAGFDVREQTLMAEPACGMWTAWVRISGGWEGAIALNCPPEMARMAAVSMFRVEPDAATIEEAREALAELVNIVGGNLKALLPPPCQSSLPVLTREALGKDIAERGSKVAEMWASCLGWKFSIALTEAGDIAHASESGTKAPPSANRREFTRAAVNVAMALVTADKTIHCGRVRDISMNGVCCECSEMLPVGQQCRLVLFLGDPNDSIQVEASARVVRAVDAGPAGFLVAVELSEVNLDSFHHICALVLYNAADEAAAEQDLRNHLGIRNLS